MKPDAIPAVYRALRRYYETHDSPVAAFAAVRTNDPFRVLVSTILSARSRDASTAKVCAKLFERLKTFADIERMPAGELERELHPLGFFHAKTMSLKALPAAVRTLFGGRIPETVEELVLLPGVGRKTANLIVAEAFDKPALCVDVHVQRICNRLGLIKTRNPLETEKALRNLLPVRYWKSWNRYLVAFGQTLCLPVRPRCATCPILRYCDWGLSVFSE
ncbi:MAG: endonuclease III [Kiritimatiellia bacterium]